MWQLSPINSKSIKRLFEHVFIGIYVIVLIASLATTAFAPSGRTYSNGGQRNNSNKSGLGSYYYHHGEYPAYLQTSGYCPYRDLFPHRVSVRYDKTVFGIGIGEKVLLLPLSILKMSTIWMSHEAEVIHLY